MKTFKTTETNSAIQEAIDSAPDGTSGLVCEPWSPGEVYGVAADWSQAAAPVYFFGGVARWDARQYQVADFAHRPADALDSHLRESIMYSRGDEAEARELVQDAIEF